jgi:hypothetical protein
VFFFHAEYIKKAEFFFSPFDQETVGVKEENYSKNGNDPHTHIHHRSQTAINGWVESEGANIIEHDDRADTREQEREVCFAVLFHIGKGEFAVEKLMHLLHHL